MTTQTVTTPEQDQATEKKIRHSGSCSPTHRRSAKRRWRMRCTSSVAGVGFAPASGKRRPRRRPSRQRLGADDHRSVGPRRREAVARVPEVVEGQPLARRGQGRHSPHDALRVLRQRHRLLFATAFDGDWDTYIDDFVAKIPDYLDIIDSAWDGWPGIRSPGAKDYLVKHQITAEGWYVAYPDLTVAEIRGCSRCWAAISRAADKVGTLHDMRFVFLDNDTKLFFATTYDGDLDPYIDDFATKIPNSMDLWLCNFEGYPGMRNPRRQRTGSPSTRLRPMPGMSTVRTSPRRRRESSRASARRSTNSSTRSAARSAHTSRATERRSSHGYANSNSGRTTRKA